MHEVVFWQRIISPHMAGLASALAERGVSVKYRANESVSKERASHGWTAPAIPGVDVALVQDARHARVEAERCGRDAIHIVQGLRRNGYIAELISWLKLARRRWGVVMETVDDRGWRGILKRVDYSRAFSGSWAPDFALGIGERAPDWIRARGMQSERTFPFAYFLSEAASGGAPSGANDRFRVGFAGSLIRRKRLDLLLEALKRVGREDTELVVVGSGELEADLRRRAHDSLGSSRVQWLGRMPMEAARREIASMDCLVLPSDFDGWGAVVSEALLAGVPAICSDRCGSAVVVRASEDGGVFEAGNVEALVAVLRNVVARGRLASGGRARLAEWAKCVARTAGAAYLEQILAHVYNGAPRPTPPWAVTPFPRGEAAS